MAKPTATKKPLTADRLPFHPRRINLLLIENLFNQDDFGYREQTARTRLVFARPLVVIRVTSVSQYSRRSLPCLHAFSVLPRFLPSGPRLPPSSRPRRSRTARRCRRCSKTSSAPGN